MTASCTLISSPWLFACHAHHRGQSDAFSFRTDCGLGSWLEWLRYGLAFGLLRSTRHTTRSPKEHSHVLLGCPVPGPRVRQYPEISTPRNGLLGCGPMVDCLAQGRHVRMVSFLSGALCWHASVIGGPARLVLHWGACCSCPGESRQLILEHETQGTRRRSAGQDPCGKLAGPIHDAHDRPVAVRSLGHTEALRPFLISLEYPWTWQSPPALRDGTAENSCKTRPQNAFGCQSGGPQSH